MKYEFEGIFKEYIEDFVNFKRSLGYLYHGSEYILFRFQNFCKEYFPDALIISQELALKWAEKCLQESNNHRLNRIAVIREFSKYLNSIGVYAYLIPTEITAKTKTQKYIPHIYTTEELSSLFQSMDSTPRSIQNRAMHLIVPVIYRLIYCCGLRPIEARRLQIKDVNLQTGVIEILESKGHKDRIVMLSDDMLDLCCKYHTKVEDIYPNRKYFFHSHKKTGMFSEPWISRTFKNHLIAIGLNETSGNNPRLYDLRHTFATHRLYKWISEGEDVNACMPYLSEYMGHSVLSNTAYYIHLVPEFYPQMTQLMMDNYGELITEADYENA